MAGDLRPRRALAGGRVGAAAPGPRLVMAGAIDGRGTSAGDRARAGPPVLGHGGGGTGLGFPAREILCGVGEVVGFFALAVFRLPVWALTLGDRFGSSEPLDRFGTSIIETACRRAVGHQRPTSVGHHGPTGEGAGAPARRNGDGGARATVATRATEAEGP